MVKEITIGSKTYLMKSSVHMLFRYRQRFDEELLPKIGALDKKRKLVDKDDTEVAMSLMEDMLELGSKLAYVMVCEQKDDDSLSYDDFLKGLDTDDMAWINEVIALAMTTFRGNISDKKRKAK